MVLLDLGDCYADFRFFPLTTFLYMFTTASAYDSLISTPTAIPTPHILHMPQHDSYLSYNQKGWFSVPPPPPHICTVRQNVVIGLGRYSRKE